jgi:integrase
MMIRMETQTTTKNRWQTFIRTYTSKSTIKTYKASIKKFFQHIYKDQFTTLEEAADKYFSENRDHKEDITSFFISIKDSPPKTVTTFLAAVKVFLIDNDVELTQKFWRKLRRRKKGSRAVTQDVVPSNKQLRQILTHMRAKGKALFLTLSSSGMRIGETLKLQLDDLELNSKPAKIHIRGEYTKSGNPRTAFISSEATETLTAWLNIRTKSLQAAIGRSRGHKPKEDDNRVFSFTKINAYSIWNNALDKAGLNGRDKTTERRKFHPHVLRKFFRSQLGTVIPVDIVEALMGHEGYLTQVYRRYSLDQLGEFYLKGEATLSVFTEMEEISKLRKDVDERNKALQTVVNGLTRENMELKEKMGTVEEKMATLTVENKGYSEDLVNLQKNFNLILKEINKLKGIQEEKP